MNFSNKSLAPDVRKTARTKYNVERFEHSRLQLRCTVSAFYLECCQEDHTISDIFGFKVYLSNCVIGKWILIVASEVCRFILIR